MRTSLKLILFPKNNDNQYILSYTSKVKCYTKMTLLILSKKTSQVLSKK
jgi:hypothetical protein